MTNKVRVHGHAMNRTALGIAHAYKVMYPHATLDDLNKAFPIALNSSNRADRIFVDIKEPVIVEKIVEKEIIVRDTVYLQQLQEIEKNFNAAQFVAGKADLSEDAKFVLHDLAKLLKNNPELKLRIVGHTSKEGTEEFNQKLSESRAKAAVDFLVNERGVEAVRLEYKGVGSSQPIDETKLDINRRTEFIVINK